MLKTLSAAVLLALAGTAFAQSTPGTTPSDNPSTTPSPAPSAKPSVTPAPVTPPAAVGGLSKCENMIGTDKDTCMQQERASTGSTSTGGSPTGTVR